MSDEELAFETRRLQTSLMVAALTCEARPQYNDFVKAHQKTLQQNAHALKQEFHRRHGRSGDREMNKFVTRLANEASARSNVDRPAFCSEADAAFRWLRRDQRVSITEYVMATNGLPAQSVEMARNCHLVQSSEQASNTK